MNHATNLATAIGHAHGHDASGRANPTAAFARNVACFNGSSTDRKAGEIMAAKAKPPGSRFSGKRIAGTGKVKRRKASGKGSKSNAWRRYAASNEPIPF